MFGDVEMDSELIELEEILGINLKSKEAENEPAVIEGTFGKGRVNIIVLFILTRWMMKTAQRF